MTAPRLTVVVVSWNEIGELSRCLEALETHPAGGGQQVIVVDNGSTDGTAEMVERDHPGHLLIRNPVNRGAAVARNIGMARARGRYIAIVDSDAYVHEGALERLCAFLDGHPDVGMVGPKLVYEDGSLQESCRRVPSVLGVIAQRFPVGPLAEHPARKRYLMLDTPHDRTMDVAYVLGATMVFRREVLTRAGGFDRRARYAGFLDDADLALRVWRAGWRVVYLPQVVVTHGYRRRSRKRNLSRQTLALVQSYLILRLKHRGRLRPPSAA
jgi:GT2 family glycosyltransferase